MLLQKKPRIPRPSTSHPHMVQRLSTPPEMRHHSYPPNSVPTYKRSQVQCYITPEQLIPLYLCPFNDIATEQTKATEKTQSAADQLSDYLATHPDATIRYHASDMILHIHSNASYVSVSHARSRLGGLVYCGDKPPPTLTDSMALS
jgi:hypothetical protein